MIFADFFDKIYVINLPSRPDRLQSIRDEMEALGIPAEAPKFTVPEAPILEDAGGFPTKGVKGNFLSHLANIEDAYENGLDRILVLEDDAIFRSFARDKAAQARLLSDVEKHDWSMWFPGHHIKTHPKGSAKPVYPTTAPFKWAHCYAVHKRGMKQLRDYMRLVCDRPAGHPEGGKMYIDGAFHHFRRQHTDHLCLVSNPVLSIQKSSDTNLGGRQDANFVGSVDGLKNFLRGAKDDIWRRTGLHIEKAGNE